MKIQIIMYMNLALIISMQASNNSNNLLDIRTVIEKSISKASSTINENDLKDVSYSYLKKLYEHNANTIEALKAVKESHTNDPLKNCLTGLIEEMCKDPYLKRCLTQDSSMTRIGALNKLECSKGQNQPVHYQHAMRILKSCGKEFITYTTLNKVNIDQANQDGNMEAYLSTEKQRLYQIGKLLQQAIKCHNDYGKEEEY